MGSFLITLPAPTDLASLPLTQVVGKTEYDTKRRGRSVHNRLLRKVISQKSKIGRKKIMKNYTMSLTLRITLRISLEISLQ